MTEETHPTGLILAGGRARRMGGGDKCLLPLGGRSLLEHTISRARPQVGELLLNANGDSQRFAHTGLTVLPDAWPEPLGPLAGLHAGLRWLADERPQCRWLASFACDTPFFPADLVARLHARAIDAGAPLAVACSGGRTHPVFGLWHQSLQPQLEQTLAAGEIPPLQQWVREQGGVEVVFEYPENEPFFNINRPADLERAEALWASR